MYNDKKYDIFGDICMRASKHTWTRIEERDQAAEDEVGLGQEGPWSASQASPWAQSSPPFLRTKPRETLANVAAVLHQRLINTSLKPLSKRDSNRRDTRRP